MPVKHNANHFGTLLTFKPGIDKAVIEAALAKLADLCDSPPKLQAYDDQWGSPCFYIP